MSKLPVFAATTSGTTIFIRYFWPGADSTTYLRGILLAVFLSYVGFVIHSRVISPLFTSPLIGIPLIKRKGWAEVLSLIPAPVIRDAMDNIPNDGLLRRLDTLNQEVIVLTTPRLAAEFLTQRDGDFQKMPSIRRAVAEILGNGVATSEGEDHRIQRKAVTPAFNPRVIKDLYPFFWTKAAEMIRLIKSDIAANIFAGLGGIIDMDDWSSRVALDMISEAGFGSSFNSLEKPFNALNRWYRSAFVVDENTRALFLFTILTHPNFTRLLPFEKVRQKFEGLKGVRKWIRNEIEERERKMFETVETTKDGDVKNHKDIVSNIMKSKTLNTDGLLEQSLTILGAGHETSATALTWGIHELSQPEHQHYQATLRAEIRKNLPSLTSGAIMTSELLESLPFLQAVSQEILRLHAPLITIGRYAVKDTILGGTHIPKGTAVRVSPWAFGRSKKLWGDDADVFRPERWLELKDKKPLDAEAARDESLLHNITFGHGVHHCIGRGFALAENKTLLAALIGSFEFKQINDKHVDPVSVYGITGKILGLYVEIEPVEGW